MAEFTPAIRRRYERYAAASLTWDPERGGRRPAVCWEDALEEDLGPDPSGERFTRLAGRMMTGRYYPPDAIDFFGPWQTEGREIRAGDRILQRARLLPFSPWPVAWAMTEVFLAHRGADVCMLGYVTTERHFGRGIWRARLERHEGRLTLRVASTAGPHSLLFWVGLPYARWIQRRAWRRAVEELRRG